MNAVQFHGDSTGKINLSMSATNTTRGRLFSALQDLKMWLFSIMLQSKLNWCMILLFHKDLTDTFDVNKVENEFAS